MKLKVFSDRKYLLENTHPCSILFPLWPDLHSDQIYQWTSPYSKYINNYTSEIELVPLDKADIAILPFDWRSVRGDSWHGIVNRKGLRLATEFAELVHQADKPLVVFFGSECSDEMVPIKSSLVFRQSVYRSESQFSESPIFPFFCEDFVEEYLEGKVPIRRKTEKPTVGFRGFARPPSLDRTLKSFYFHSYNLFKHYRLGTSPYKGEILRTKALKKLLSSNIIEPNIEIFDRAVFFEATSIEEKMKARLDYVNNMISSDYIFCCRGSGNYSNRFYEVLSCGRIPIFLDTDCKLPLDDVIDWEKYCVWVDEKDSSNIAEIVAEFHASLSNSEFEDLQLACRKLWVEYLSPKGFYSKCFQNLYKFSKETKEKCSL